MAFTRDSRYAAIEKILVETPEGSVAAIKLRRIESRAGRQHRVEPGDRLDLLAHEAGDAARFWEIADANEELDASQLVEEVDRTIRLSSG